MKERLIQLRKELKLSQTKFAESIGLSFTFINLVENGKKHLSDRSISDICRVHNINETWLRTGEGEMFVPLTKEEEIADMVAKIFKEDESSFKYKLAMLLLQSDAETMKMVEQKIIELYKLVEESEN